MIHARCCFSPPMPLSEGKSAAAHYQVARDFTIGLRQEGHRGIAFHNYCFDRVIEPAMSRMSRQQHILDVAKWGGSKKEAQLLETGVGKLVREWLE